MINRLSDVLKRPLVSLTILGSVYVASRFLWRAMGVRFDVEPLEFYWQYVDPALLRHDFWRSLFYLEQQPPAFNFFLGAVLRLFPNKPDTAFYIAYLLLGLLLSLSLFALMRRMNVDVGIALLIAIVFTVSPSTALYENILFYEYPLATLFCVAALFLHRYAAAGRLQDGIIFFSALAIISGTRSVYHLAWFAATVILVTWALRQKRRRTLLAAMIPGIFVVAFCIKHAIVFHNFVPGGGVYGGINLAVMTIDQLSSEQIDPLIATGKISRISNIDPFELINDFKNVASDEALEELVPRPRATGIPIRDGCYKTNGYINLNCAWLADISNLYARDALVLLREYPMVYVRQVMYYNLSRYFRPDTQEWPFDGRKRDRNKEILARPLAAYIRLTGQPWLSYLALPGLLAFGLVKVISVARPRASETLKSRGRRETLVPFMVTLAFMLGNMFYLTAVTLVLSEADHNRYRAEISSYYAALLGIFLTTMVAAIAAGRDSS